MMFAKYEQTILRQINYISYMIILYFKEFILIEQKINPRFKNYTIANIK